MFSMTRSMLRDALSALAAVTLVSATTGSAAAAQAKSIKVYQAAVALDAVQGLKPKALKAAKALAMPARNPNGQDWRWFQDYGSGKYQPSVQRSCRLQTTSRP
jgi:hypothetical protein